MNVDLPNLTSINSIWGNSFQYPRSVTLESISEYWILIVFRYSKSSKCQAIWFIPIRSMGINFEYELFDRFDFIYRCFFHSRWSCHNKRWLWFWFWFWFWLVIPSLDLHIHSIPFHFVQWSLNIQCLLCLIVPNPLPSFFGHWFRIQSSIDSFPSFHHNPDWFS